MDDQTAEMERVTQEMRELMRLWLQNPDNKELKQRFDDAHAVYQRMFLAYKQRQRAEIASGDEVTRGAYKV